MENLHPPYGASQSLVNLHFQEAGRPPEQRGDPALQRDRTVEAPAPACILLAGKSPQLLYLRARIVGAAGMLCSTVDPRKAPDALKASFHDAVVICHTVDAENTRIIVRAAYEGQRRTRTLLLTRIPQYVPPALVDCHFDDIYCWYEGVPVFVTKLRRLVELPDHRA
ncbi:MAG: hypothetical protein ACR2JE_03570 [Acidobacteriaceae bacterium]